MFSLYPPSYGLRMALRYAVALLRLDFGEGHFYIWSISSIVW